MYFKLMQNSKRLSLILLRIIIHYKSTIVMLFSAIIIKDIYKKNNNNVSMRNNYRHLCKSRYIKSRILTHF